MGLKKKHESGFFEDNLLAPESGKKLQENEKKRIGHDQANSNGHVAKPQLLKESAFTKDGSIGFRPTNPQNTEYPESNRSDSNCSSNENYRFANGFSDLNGKSNASNNLPVNSDRTIILDSDEEMEPTASDNDNDNGRGSNIADDESSENGNGYDEDKTIEVDDDEYEDANISYDIDTNCQANGEDSNDVVVVEVDANDIQDISDDEEEASNNSNAKKSNVTEATSNNSTQKNDNDRPDGNSASYQTTLEIEEASTIRPQGEFSIISLF